MKKFLEKLKAAKEKRANELREMIRKAETADECRALGDTLQAVLDELRDVEEQLANLDDEGNGGQQAGQEPAGEGRSANPLRDFRGSQVVAQYQQRQGNGQDADPYDTVEYRTAFMNYICRGVAIPLELRADATTTAADAGAVIPTTILNELIKELKSYGEIYARVRRLQVQGGVQIPVSSLRPKATWITANTATSESDKQKLQANDKISFNYYGLECKLSQTLLVSITTLEVFQEEFVKLAAEATAEAMDIAIIAGDGNGMPTGIVNDARVPAANKITMTAEEFGSWAGWKKKVFGKMKKAYRKGCFIMAQGTFDGYVDGMVDQNGQPIGRVNYGIDGGETYRFGGKEVLTVEDNVVADYEAAGSGDVVAVFVDLSNYGVNTNMEMQVVKWVDHDTNEVKNKTILVCDGKLIDPHGALIIKKA